MVSSLHVPTGAMPTPAQVAEVILTMPYEVERCRYVPCRRKQFSDMVSCSTCNRSWDYGDVPNDRPGQSCEDGELWIEFLGIWIRMSDWSYVGDLGRPRVYPGWWGRRTIRRAYKKREAHIGLDAHSDLIRMLKKEDAR